jgi:hypothetical protein
MIYGVLRIFGNLYIFTDVNGPIASTKKPKNVICKHWFSASCKPLKNRRIHIWRLIRISNSFVPIRGAGSVAKTLRIRNTAANRAVFPCRVELSQTVKFYQGFDFYYKLEVRVEGIKTECWFWSINMIRKIRLPTDLGYYFSISFVLV